MNQSNIKKIGNFIFIDFKEYIWRLLEQWKAILAFVLIILVLFTGYSYISFNNNNDSEIEIVPQSADTILEGLDEDERDLVISVLRMKENQDEISSYINNSALMSIDAYSVSLLTFVWDIKSGQLPDTGLASDYYGELTSNEMLGCIKESWGEQYSDKQINELIVVNAMSYDDPVSSGSIETGHISMNIIVPEDVDSENTEAAVAGKAEEIANRLIQKGRRHTAVLASVYKQTYPNPLSISDKQANTYAKLSNLSAQINNIINMSFSDGQKNAYNQLVHIGENEGDDTPSANPAPQTKASFKMSKRKLVIGAGASVLVYMILYLLYCIASGKVNGARALKEMSGIRNFGEWYSDNKKVEGLIGKVTNSKTFYKKRHCLHLEKDGAIDKIVESISCIADNKGIKSIVIVSSKLADESYKDFIKTVSEKLNALGYNYVANEVDFKRGIYIDESDLKQGSGVVIAVDHAHTLVGDIKDVCEKCIYYSVPVLGSVYLG